MKHLAILTALIASITPAAAISLAPISPHQALAYRGQCVTVQGTASMRSDQRLGLDIDLDGKDSPAFGYVLPGDQANFTGLDTYAGQKIAITGIVNFYHGRAEIRMTSSSQLKPASSSDDTAGLTHIGPEFARGGEADCS